MPIQKDGYEEKRASTSTKDAPSISDPSNRRKMGENGFISNIEADILDTPSLPKGVSVVTKPFSPIYDEVHKEIQNELKTDKIEKPSNFATKIIPATPRFPGCIDGPKKII